jgi:hypothetical protein
MANGARFPKYRPAIDEDRHLVSRIEFEKPVLTLLEGVVLGDLDLSLQAQFVDGDKHLLAIGRPRLMIKFHGFVPRQRLSLGWALM